MLSKQPLIICYSEQDFLYNSPPLGIPTFSKKVFSLYQSGCKLSETNETTAVQKVLADEDSVIQTIELL